MSKRGLPTSVQMKHDAHYVEELFGSKRSIGRMIPIEKITPNPEQPRVEFGDLEELTASIKEQGVLEPLLVKPYKESGKYMIIAGERRWRASTLAGLDELPCIELDIDDQTIAEIALVENLQRKDLTIWEVADGLADLSERFGYTHEEIAKKIGKSRTTVTESMAIAGLPEEIRKRCHSAKINSKSTLVEISRQFDTAAMHGLLDQIESEGINRKQVRDKKTTGQKKPKIPKTGKDTITKPSDEPENTIVAHHETFSYASKSERFVLNIKFEAGEFDEMDVLRALKEVFDSIKNN